MASARFISLDGLDGTGKSSQLGPLGDWLRSRGIVVTACRDPGSTPTGDAIRAILLDRHDLHVDPTSEMLLYMAARAQLVADVIAPALDRGEWVLADRFLLATIVYQGHAGGLDPEAIRTVGRVATSGIEPDLVDRPAARRARRGRLDRPLDKLESRGDGYRSRVRAGYLAEAAADPARVRVVDADGDQADVAARIRAVVGARFPELG